LRQWMTFTYDVITVNITFETRMDIYLWRHYSEHYIWDKNGRLHMTSLQWRLHLRQEWTFTYDVITVSITFETRMDIYLWRHLYLKQWMTFTYDVNIVNITFETMNDIYFPNDYSAYITIVVVFCFTLSWEPIVLYL